MRTRGSAVDTLVQVAHTRRSAFSGFELGWMLDVLEAGYPGYAMHPAAQANFRMALHDASASGGAGEAVGGPEPASDHVAQALGDDVSVAWLRDCVRAA